MTRCRMCFAGVDESRAGGQCPSCGEALPTGGDGAPRTCIVMAGARTTGKSIYIAVLVKQLEQYCNRWKMDLQPASAAVRAGFAENYVKPLYEQRNLIQPTPRVQGDDAYQRDPLEFVITFPDGGRHHLVIQDVAGEDLEKPDGIPDGALPFFAHADAVFFLWDPLKVNAIREALAGVVPDQNLSEERDPRLVLASTMRLMNGGRPRFAVIMSKFDVMQVLRNVEGVGELAAVMDNAGSALRRDTGFDLLPDDADRVDQEIRSLLDLLGASPLMAAFQRAGGEHRFFAVSALGNSPNGQSQHPRGIAPFRCLDPLRWVLAGTGVM